MGVVLFVLLVWLVVSVLAALALGRVFDRLGCDEETEVCPDAEADATKTRAA